MIRPGGFIAQFSFFFFSSSQDNVSFVLPLCFVFISRVVMVSWSGSGEGGLPVVFVLLPHIVQIVAV